MRGSSTVFLLLLAACGGREPNNPARLTLVNRTGRDVNGALLLFDRELVRVDPRSEGGFERVRLRTSPADSLRLEGGRLRPGESATYRVAGAGGAPRLKEGRWLVDGAFGPAIGAREIEIR